MTGSVAWSLCDSWGSCYSWRGNFLSKFERCMFSIFSWHDRRTDRRTDGAWRVRSLL